MFEQSVETPPLDRYPIPLGLAQSSAINTQLIKIATTEAEKDEIYRLRYKVYIEEMRGEERHTEADLGAKMLRDDLDDRSYHFYGRQNGKIVICSRTNLRRDGDSECEENLELQNFAWAFPNFISMSSRLALHSRHRGSLLVKQLLCEMYQFWCAQDILFDFIDCHPSLVPLYARLGWRLYKPGFKHPKYTYVFPMVLVVDDLNYLERVKSPFLPIGSRFHYGSKGRDILLSKYPEAEETFVSAEIDPPKFWEVLAGKLLDVTDSIARYDLFVTLTFEEAKLLLSLGYVVSCRRGDEILNPGDPGRDIYLILNGSFEVQKRRRGGHGSGMKLMKILSAGEIFGETRYLREELRYSSVRAREDSTVLVLNSKSLDRLIGTAPKLAAKVFRNMARIVTSRLCESIKFTRFHKGNGAKHKFQD
jgi:hypothetical protein